MSFSILASFSLMWPNYLHCPLEKVSNHIFTLVNALASYSTASFICLIAKHRCAQSCSFKRFHPFMGNFTFIACVARELVCGKVSNRNSISMFCTVQVQNCRSTFGQFVIGLTWFWMEFLGSGIVFGGMEPNRSLPSGYEFKNLTIDRVSCIKIYTFTLQIGFG